VAANTELSHLSAVSPASALCGCIPAYPRGSCGPETSGDHRANPSIGRAVLSAARSLLWGRSSCGYGAPVDTESDIRALKHGLSELARAVEELADAVEDAVQGRSASEMSGARSASHTARQIAQRFM